MGFAHESGYTPATIEEMMLSVMNNVNTQFGQSYTAETFIGTNFYKYFYALIQDLQENEIKTSEIFLNLQQYFRVTNETISRPVVTNPGLVETLFRNNYVASVKKPIDADAGKCYVCVDVKDDHAKGTITITSYANLVSGTHDTVTVGSTVFTAQSTAVTLGGATFRASTDNATTAASLAAQINGHATAGALVHATVVGAVVTIRALTRGTGGNAIVLGYADNDTNVGATKSGTVLAGGISQTVDYDTTKLAIATIIKDSVVAGVVTQGTEITAITLSNGQSFDFKFNLPSRIDTLLRLTITLSTNNMVFVAAPEDVKTLLLENIAARYALGKNFEPQKYFSVLDAPWASQVLLEYSIDNGSNYLTTIYAANYDALLTITLANVTLVEN